MKNKHTKALKAAFPYTIPIFAGFSFWYPCLMSLTIFAGSMEFVTANMILGAFNPIQAFTLTLMINARHLFYGISMLDKFKGTGLKKLYLIFGMCDETFSVNYTAKIPEDVDKGLFMTYVTLLNQFYWVSGATIGGLLGNFVKFNTEGLDFVMTAMFAVIFAEQWLKEKNHTSSILGLCISVICLAVFGADDFIIPSMAAILISLTLIRRFIEKDGEEK